MNIDQAIAQLQECKRQGAERVVVCSSDRHFGGNLLEIELSEPYGKEKPGEAVINGDFTNPFTKEEYEALVRIIAYSGAYMFHDSEPLLNDLHKKMEGWVNFYKQQDEDIEE